MDRAIAEQLKHVAYNIAFNLCRHVPHGRGRNDFQDFNYSVAPTWNALGTNDVHYSFGPYAEIIFRNITPGKVSAIRFDDPVLLERETIDADSTIIVNETDSDVERVYTFTNSFESSKEKASRTAIGLSVSTSISATAGDSIYGAEVTTSSTFSSSFDQEFSQSAGVVKSYEREDSTTVVVPPRKRFTIVNETAKAKLRQRVETDCLLDFSIQVDSHGDWNPRWDTLHDFYLTIGGFDHRSDSNAFRQHWRDNPSDYRIPDSMLTATLVSQIKYDDATSGNILVRQSDA